MLSCAVLLRRVNTERLAPDPCVCLSGAGDFQRKGRGEMMNTGFFRPFVTPEWSGPVASETRRRPSQL